jgi:hypothetical protein
MIRTSGMSGSVAGPIACRLPPLDVSPFPEILRVQRRHLTHLRHHPWQDVEPTISAATAPSSRSRRNLPLPGWVAPVVVVGVP